MCIMLVDDSLRSIHKVMSVIGQRYRAGLFALRREVVIRV